jgi:hypothetical protein
MLPSHTVNWMTDPELPSQARDRQHRFELDAMSPHDTGVGRRLVDLARGMGVLGGRLDAGSNPSSIVATCCA